MTAYSTQLLANERPYVSIMYNSNNLKKYFGSYFLNITFLQVILYFDKPLIVTFTSANKNYIGYLYKFDDTNFNADWLITETSKIDVLQMVNSHTSVKNTFQKEKQGYHFSVTDGKPKLLKEKTTNFDINSDFYITDNTPNELSLNQVRNSIMYSELKSNIETFKKDITQQYAPNGNVAVKDFGTYQDNMTAAQVLLDALNDDETWDVAQEQYNKLTDFAKVKQAIAAIIDDGNIIPEWEAESYEYSTMVLDAIESM